MTDPACYQPVTPDDFIGDARKVARILCSKASVLVRSGQPAKILLYGPPGVGKTRLAENFAGRLAGHPTAIESINGRNVTIDVVRHWQESARYIPMNHGYSVVILNELDTCPAASQDLLLSCLDILPPRHAFLGTSNLQLELLSERFGTRLQQFKVKGPTSDEIAEFLGERWGIDKRTANEIALGAGGNVRCACLDLQSIMDARKAA